MRHRFNPLPTVVGVWALAYGVWLALPWHTFDSAPAFAQLAQWGSEEVYAVLFILTGLAILQPVSRAVRFVGHCGSVFLSVMLAVAFCNANWRGGAVPTYGVIAFACAWGLIEGTR